MFDNMGRKIKTLAQVLCWIGIICSVVSGIVMRANDEDLTVLAFIVIIIGSLVSWLSSFVLYGFGQLVENSDILVEKLAPDYRESITDTEELENIDYEKLEKISNEYADSAWAESIKKLSNEELQERIDSEDWQYEYRALCKKELENRK